VGATGPKPRGLKRVGKWWRAGRSGGEGVESERVGGVQGGGGRGGRFGGDTESESERMRRGAEDSTVSSHLPETTDGEHSDGESRAPESHKLTSRFPQAQQETVTPAPPANDAQQQADAPDTPAVYRQATDGSAAEAEGAPVAEQAQEGEAGEKEGEEEVPAEGEEEKGNEKGSGEEGVSEQVPGGMEPSIQKRLRRVRIWSRRKRGRERERGRERGRKRG